MRRVQDLIVWEVEKKVCLRGVLGIRGSIGVGFKKIGHLFLIVGIFWRHLFIIEVS